MKKLCDHQLEFYYKHMALWGNCIFMYIFVNKCCFDILLHNLCDILYHVCASYIDNMWNE